MDARVPCSWQMRGVSLNPVKVAGRKPRRANSPVPLLELASRRSASAVRAVAGEAVTDESIITRIPSAKAEDFTADSW